MIFVSKAMHYYQLIYLRTFEICLEIHELDPACFHTAPELASLAALKKTKVKLDLLNDIDMLLMVEKGIRGGICHAIHQYVTANNKYMKKYDKNEESSYLQVMGCKYLNEWAMSQTLPVYGLKKTENKSQFIKIL